MGQADRSAVERDRSGVPFSRLSKTCSHPLSDHHHVPPEPDVRLIVPDDVRTNLRLLIVPPSVWAVGHNNRRSDEGLGEVSRCAQYFRVRFLYAVRCHEPSDQRKIREKTRRENISRR